MLAAFPLTTGRNKRLWYHCHSQESPYISTSFFTRPLKKGLVNLLYVPVVSIATGLWLKAIVVNTLASVRLRLISSSLHMFLCGNISTDDCGRELFKSSKDSASLRVCNEKKFLVLGFVFFCE